MESITSSRLQVPELKKMWPSSCQYQSRRHKILAESEYRQCVVVMNNDFDHAQFPDRITFAQ